MCLVPGVWTLLKQVTAGMRAIAVLPCLSARIEQAGHSLQVGADQLLGKRRHAACVDVAQHLQVGAGRSMVSIRTTDYWQQAQ